MKSKVLFIIIVLFIVGSGIRCFGYQCYICESEVTTLQCKDPTDPSVNSDALFCDVDGIFNVCSWTIYKRKCLEGGIANYILGSENCSIFTARGYAKRGICRRLVSVCLSVCVSVCHTPVIVSKRLNVGLRKQRRTISL